MRAHGAMVPLHSGIAARAGFEAASIARAGGAGLAVLEGDTAGPGLIQLLRGDPQALQPEQWHGETIDDIGWKFFPACFASMVAIEAALQLPRLDVNAITAITLRLPDRMLSLVGHGPQTDELYDRLMSLRWSVACAVRNGRYDLEATQPNEATMALAQRIEIRHEPALDALLPQTLAADIEVLTKDGPTQLRYRRPAAKDPPATLPRGWTRSLDETALLAKFNALTRESPAISESLQALLAA
jgi:2-methylcitrate dehydratase PrpD